MNSNMKESLAESEKAVITLKAALPNSSPHQCNMLGISHHATVTPSHHLLKKQLCMPNPEKMTWYTGGCTRYTDQAYTQGYSNLTK